MALDLEVLAETGQGANGLNTYKVNLVNVSLEKLRLLATTHLGHSTITGNGIVLQRRKRRVLRPVENSIVVRCECCYSLCPRCERVAQRG